METEEIKVHIDNVIKKTFEVIQEVYNRQKENSDYSESKETSRIIFPHNRFDEKRISEQELRFVFVEQLNKEIANSNDWNVFYSVETPTKDTYRFSDTEEPRIDPNGRSGNFDLVIHDDNFKRIALIEFKANNPAPNEYLKDFIKLNNSKEEGGLSYFIQIIENYDSRTFSNIHQKICKYEKPYRCWSLKKGKEITDDKKNNQSE